MKLRKDRNCSLDFRTCKICNKPLDNLTALATHIFRLHHIKSKDYYDKYLKTNDDGKCICCGKETTYRNFYYHKFCSTKCKNLIYYSDDKNIELHKNSYTDEVKIKMAKKRKEYFKLEENKNKLSNTVKNYFKNPLNREKTSKSVSLSIKNGKQKVLYEYDNIKFQSYYELAFYVYLKDHKIRFEYLQNRLSIPYYHNNSQYDYFPDFKVFNTLVEIKGPHFFDKNGSMINPFDRTQDAKYEAKHQCMIKNNVHIITNCDTYIKYVEDNYSKNFKQIHIYKKDTH